MDEPADLTERLRGIASFLPVFEAPGFVFGDWVPPTRERDDVWTMGYYDLSPTAIEFIEAAYHLGWVVAGFDWGSWQHTDEGRRLLRDPESVQRADPDQLASLLTVLIRADRFVDGELGHAYASGLLTAILRRADELAESEVELRSAPNLWPE